ncbi:MAG TPA: prepilin-type N-terminal cleavage/methylation domain-containing protein [Acidobacteriota bacterium]|nr:prepilin-type N-terminal cleavage/methylation domain-containing protein [Acidobacteriota bacterium]
MRPQAGFTLIEVLMAVVIIGMLAAVGMRSIQSGIERKRIHNAEEEMDELAWAITGNPDLYANGMRLDFGYIGDVGSLPSSLDDLVTRPGGYGTWNGPYFRNRFDEDGQGYQKNAWGNTYTFTNGITITSTGGGSPTMTRSVAAQPADLTNTVVSGIVTDAGGNQPGDSTVAITVIVTYPDGTGGTTTATTNPASSGAFAVPGIPVGIRRVEAVYRATNDTATAYICVLPKTGAFVALRVPGAPFATESGGAGTIEYVEGSVDLESGNSILVFDITNSGGAGISVEWLIATYSPSVYFGQIEWAGATVFSETNPRATSGDTCSFTAEQTLNAYDTVTVTLTQFRDSPMGGVATDVSNTDFTITFSNGSEISFNSGS